MMEESGNIVATRHCRSPDSQKDVYGALVRINHMDFMAPMLIGRGCRKLNECLSRVIVCVLYTFVLYMCIN